MTNTLPWYSRIWPGSLSTEVARVHPPAEFHRSVGHLIGDWVAPDEVAGRLARPKAEEHVHGRLADAAAVGREHGWAACHYLWWPLTAVLLIASLLLATR